MELPSQPNTSDFDPDDNPSNGSSIHWCSLDLQPKRISYVKRFRMERDLANLPSVSIPPGYTLEPWSRTYLEAHAEVLFASFQGEIDSMVFPSLASIEGCGFLMKEISKKASFVPEATWLLLKNGELVGSIQGLRDRSGMGAIQNLGIRPAHRSRGLGEALLNRALQGFCQASLGRVMLEVTAQNDGAVRLYRRSGFIRRKILYKAVPAPIVGIK
jgi:ribosomal protein S18 acetylase RimI-like enzyme